MATGLSENHVEQEQIHFQNVITAFKKYAPYAVRPYYFHPRSRAQLCES